MRTLASLLLATGLGIGALAAQAPTPPPVGQGAPAGGVPGAAQGPAGRGPTFPAQQRALADAAVLARGKTLYTINCAACHGADARGGDQGGPNLLRSQILLDDQHGELILPIVRGGRAEKMPPLPLIPDADVTAIAEFVHSLAAAGRGRNSVPLNILVGNASAGQTAFAAKCASCHSVSGDLRGLATRVPDPATLQNFWISGGGGGGRGGGGGGGAAPVAANARPVTVTVTLPSGQKTEGRLVRVDDFFVSLVDQDGATRSFRRDGDRPAVEVHDPLEKHRLLLPNYTDDEIHNITAYLVTIK